MVVQRWPHRAGVGLTGRYGRNGGRVFKTAFFVMLFIIGALFCIGISMFSLSFAVETMHGLAHAFAKDLEMKGWEDA